MKEIPLTQGRVALVDDEDYEELNKYKWFLISTPRNCYAARRERVHIVYMHRQLLGVTDSLEVDHIDHDGLNNQRNNIRLCTTRQNNHNSRAKSTSTSQYKGVTWYKAYSKWKATIRYGKEHLFLGYFQQEEDAARAYDQMARRLHGEFAYTNFEGGRACA